MCANKPGRMERLEFRANPSTAKLVEELAKNENASKSEILRTLVRRSLDHIEDDTRTELKKIDKLIQEQESKLEKLKQTRERLHRQVEDSDISLNG